MNTAAGAHDEQLVLSYTTSVFMSFRLGLLRWPASPARMPTQIVLPGRSGVGAFTLIVNLDREKPRAIASTQATEHDA